MSVQFFAGEVEQRGCEHQEHEDAEKIVGRQRSENLWPEGEEVGTPRQPQRCGEPVRHVVGNFRVLEKIDDDAEKSEDTSGGDESGGIESAGAGFAFVFFLGGSFDEQKKKQASEHSASGSNREIRTSSERQRTHAKNFDGDDQSNS